MKNTLKLIGLGLLVWILFTIDLGKAVLTLGALHLWWLLGYLVASMSVIFLRIGRLGVCLRRMEHPLPFSDRYVSTLEPALLGIVTPGRLGEFARAGYLRARGVPLLDALVLSLVERAVDFGMLCVVGLAGCVYIFGQNSYRLPLMVAILLLVPVCSLLALYALDLRRLTGVLAQLGLRLLPERYLPRGIASATGMQEVFLRTLGPHLLFSGLAFALSLLQIYCLAEAFSFVADMLVVLFSYSSSTLVSLLPISFAGLGTRDTTYIFILGREGILREQALIFSLLDGIFMPVVSELALLLPAWFYLFWKKRGQAG